MQKNMLKLGVVLIVALITMGVGGWGPLASAGAREIKPKAPVPQTGQTQCWDAVGSPINCARTGQDGDIQAGVASPTPRFTDRGNGTVRDNLTGLIWLKRVDCGGSLASWSQALLFVTSLASGICGLSDASLAGDWRLPNLREMLSLADFAFSEPAISNTAGTGIWTEGDPFSGSPARGFWTSTTRPGTPDSTWYVDLHDGTTYVVPKTISGSGSLWLWPVRGGD
jgi:hypothetical protein